MIKINETPESNILLTGACGYVGRALIPKLGNASLYIIDRAHNNEISQMSRKFICNDLNQITSEEKNFLTTYIGTVVHLAAARSDDFNKRKYIDDNLNATKSFLDALNPDGIKMFIHVGSVAAIDGEILEQNDSTINCADDYYRISKYQQQKIIESWSITNNIPLVILAPSAIHDMNAKVNSTNIGRLEKAVTFFKIVPEINVLKSLTTMSSLVTAIKYFVNLKQEDIYRENSGLIQRYLIFDRPVMTVTEICKKKFKAKLVIKIPKLQSLLLILASLINFIGLQKIIPLSKDRVIKLYKPTDYNNVSGYKEWLNEKA